MNTQAINEFLRRPRLLRILRIAAVALIGLGCFLIFTAPDKSEAASVPKSKDETPAATPPAPQKLKPVVIRDHSGENILHDYNESFALLVGAAESSAELTQVKGLFKDRGFAVKTLLAPTLATLTSEIEDLQKTSSLGKNTRFLLYFSGETIDPEGSNEIFYRTADTPSGQNSAQNLRKSAFRLDSLRYIGKDLGGSPVLVLVNSGLRSTVLEQRGEDPAFLTKARFENPSPFFIVSASEGGQPSPDFPSRLVRAFGGGADSDSDRQVSTLELAKYIGAPAYLASISGEQRNGPGMVFDLPADAFVKPLSPEKLAARSHIQQPPSPTKTNKAPMPTDELILKLPEPGGTFDCVLGLRMCWQDKGKYTIRYPSAAGATEDKQVEGFWLSRTEISAQQYAQQMSFDTEGDPNAAKGNVSWLEASAFCASLTESERSANRLPEGYIYRLPYESEWEYASKLGENRFRKTNILPLAAWTKRLTNYSSPPGNDDGASGDFLAMASGVKEWCMDSYVKNDSERLAPASPAGARVVRGGLVDDQMTRLSTRFGIYSDSIRLPHLGFRIALGKDTAVTVPQIPIEPGKIYNLKELFDGSKYGDWDSYNKGLILKKAQESFKELKLYSIAVDGTSGPSTQKAVNQYQATQQLSGTGKLDDATLAALGLDNEEKKIKRVYKPWWVTRPNSPRAGDKKPPKSERYSGPLGRFTLGKDKSTKKINAREYRRYQIYERWKKVN